MAKSKEDSIVYRMEALEDLVIKQQKALHLSNQLLDMKSRLVELCEEETEIYKKENRTLKLMFACSAIMMGILCCVLLFSR